MNTRPSTGVDSHSSDSAMYAAAAHHTITTPETVLHHTHLNEAEYFELLARKAGIGLKRGDKVTLLNKPEPDGPLPRGTFIGGKAGEIHTLSARSIFKVWGDEIDTANPAFDVGRTYMITKVDKEGKVTVARLNAAGDLQTRTYPAHQLKKL